MINSAYMYIIYYNNIFIKKILPKGDFLIKIIIIMLCIYNSKGFSN